MDELLKEFADKVGMSSTLTETEKLKLKQALEIAKEPAKTPTLVDSEEEKPDEDGTKATQVGSKLDEVKIKPFHGTEDVSRWFSRFEIQAKCRGWPVAKWAQHACSYFEDEAATWVDDNRVDEAKDFKTFKERVVKRYGNKLPKPTVAVQLAQLRVKRGERVKEFAQRLVRVCRESAEPFSDQEMCTYFLQGLPERYLSFAANLEADCTLSVEELAERCSKMEAMTVGRLGELPGNADPVGTMSMSGQSGSGPMSGESRPSVRCGVCRRFGHSTAEHGKNRRTLSASQPAHSAPEPRRDSPSAAPSSSQSGFEVSGHEGKPTASRRLVRASDGKWTRPPVDKSKHQCYACKEYGHHSGDPECSMTSDRSRRATEVLAMLERGELVRRDSSGRASQG